MQHIETHKLYKLERLRRPAFHQAILHNFQTYKLERPEHLGTSFFYEHQKLYKLKRPRCLGTSFFYEHQVGYQLER